MTNAGRVRRYALVQMVLLAVAAPATAQRDWLDRLDRALVVGSPGGLFRTELSGLFDLEGYYVDQRPPGLVFGGNREFVNPRLSLFLDTRIGTRIYSLVQARIDRGFDPRARSNAARFDEYLIRYTPLDDPVLNLQVGKFATLIGNWVPRHDSWNNPFINAPVPYENVTIASDVSIPSDAPSFLARRCIPDRKAEWLPLVWGPVYASGAAVFGRVRAIDYGVEVKNAAPSSRPAVWDGRSRGWSNPTVSARLGWRPNAAWTFGVSFAEGAYLRGRAAPRLSPGAHLGDFHQRLFGFDASYAWRHVQLWGELFGARFEIPRVNDAESVAYYLEARYKVTPAFFAALRWNQQFFGEIDDGAGGDRPWDRDLWRLDTALGYRFDRHLQGKIQYGYGHQRGSLQQGEQLLAAQLTVKF